EIATRAERLCSLPGENSDAEAFEIDRKPLEQLHEVDPHLRVQGVGRLRPVQRDQQNVVVAPLARDGCEISPHRDQTRRPASGLAREIMYGAAFVTPVGDDPTKVSTEPWPRSSIICPNQHWLALNNNHAKPTEEAFHFAASRSDDPIKETNMAQIAVDRATQVPRNFRTVILAAAGGNVIEWYDFYIFGSLATIL